MTREIPEGLRSGPFGVARAARLDIPVTRLRRVDLDTPFRGVRVPRELEPSFRLRCRAYAERMPPDHYFSHVTAARLWGIWLPTRANATEVLHVTALRPSRAPRIGGG